MLPRCPSLLSQAFEHGKATVCTPFILGAVETALKETPNLLWAGPPRALDCLGMRSPEKGSQDWPILSKPAFSFFAIGVLDTSTLSQESPAQPGAQERQGQQPVSPSGSPHPSPCLSPSRTCPPPSLSLSFTGSQSPKPGWMVAWGTASDG